jgi:hypothetical protein
MGKGKGQQGDTKATAQMDLKRVGGGGWERGHAADHASEHGTEKTAGWSQRRDASPQIQELGSKTTHLQLRLRHFHSSFGEETEVQEIFVA